jgi:hypothetical protein
MSKKPTLNSFEEEKEFPGTYLDNLDADSQPFQVCRQQID